MGFKIPFLGLELRSPVGTASGTVGFGYEYAPFLDFSSLGFLTLKSITLKPQPGNPPPRLCEVPAGLINSVGLENPGLERFIEEIIPRLSEFTCPVIVSIAGETVDEYRELAARLDGRPEIDMLEINISCPNIRAGGYTFGSQPQSTYQVISAVREVTSLPLIAKLPPVWPHLTAIAHAAVEGGADCLALINSVPALALDIEQQRPRLFGGLSGPAVKPIALRMVWEVAASVSVPVIGGGGITSAGDALEFILAGATLVAIGTANFIDPQVTGRISQGIRDYLLARGISDYAELVGKAHSKAGESKWPNS